ncbi:dual adapter for phosphotyrosine and 3-phosphotyrosine and 3-phosphoinositide [Anaeramoeba flamelloides]|uniref:Dual adapter for phosphotyrosine and 3-phosphotyrosine and 3-phosphoinositide n=1 Tax=Anaeramoeba flamelloides TaxID=1746091 RepID=A0AAV7YTP6_9EUKA|nr:dual adapter for phosphotyrosine and 3-phosphotyrosine and 3-phosphoinositide [Anaeramoeba flamelloides]
MNKVVKDTQTLQFKSEIDTRTGNKRFCQYPNQNSNRHNGSSVVFNSNNNAISIEYWYLSWRIARVPISTHHFLPKENEKFIRYCGFLYKKGKQRKKKKKRWFVLNDNCITYHKNENSKAISTIFMDQIKVISLTCEKTKFELLTPGRTYYFEAENAETVKIWYKLIKAILKLRKQVQENLTFINDLDLKPKSILNRITEKNYSIFLNTKKQGLFLFFMSLSIEEGVEKILKNNFITDEEYHNIPSLQDKFQKLDSIATCSLIMKRSIQKQIPLPHDLVVFWLNKFENIEKENEREMINSIRLGDPKLRNEFLKNTSNLETALFEAEKKKKNLKTKNDQTKIEIQKNEEKIGQLTDSLSLKSKEIKELSNANTDLKQRQLEEKEKTKLIQIERQDLQKNLIKEQNENKQLTKKIHDQKKENLQLNEEKKKSDNKITEVKKKLEKLKKKHLKDQNKLNESKNKIQNLKLELNSAKESRDRLENEIKEEKIKNSTQIVENDSRETSNGQNEKEKQLLNLIEKHQIERKELQEQKFQLESKVIKINNQLDEIEKSNQNLLKKNEKLKIENLNLKKLINNSNDSVNLQSMDDNEDVNGKGEGNGKGKEKEKEKEKGKGKGKGKVKERENVGQGGNENKRKEKLQENQVNDINQENKENEGKYTKIQREQIEKIELGKECFIQLIDTVQAIKQYFEKAKMRKKGKKKIGYESSNQQLHILIQNDLWQAVKGMLQVGLKKSKILSRNKHIWNVIDSCIREKNSSQIGNNDTFVQAVKFINQYEPFIKTKNQDIFCRAWIRWALNENLLHTWIQLIKNSASVLMSYYDRDKISQLSKLLQSSAIVLEDLNEFNFTCHINLEVKKKK